MPRENTDAIGDAARWRHVNAVTAFKYPRKQNGELTSSAFLSRAEEEEEKSPGWLSSLGVVGRTKDEGIAEVENRDRHLICANATQDLFC